MSRAVNEFKKELALARVKREEATLAVSRVAERCRAIEAQLEDVSVVYRCLRNMGDVLDFADTLQAWSQSLYEWARFEKGLLALAEKQNGEMHLKNIFEIGIFRAEGKPFIQMKNAPHAPAMRALLSKLSSQTQPARLAAGELFDAEGFAFPLTVQGEMVGVFALPGEWEEKRETLQFLIAEFSLEIKKKMLYEKVKELSVADSLSGLYQRRYFFEQLKFELERALAAGAPTSILLVDIDNFKQVNDQFGHLSGDRVIREAARLLQHNSREMDLVGRYGGDEFIVMLPGAGREAAEGVARRVLAAVKEHSFSLPHLAVRPTLSIGVASAPEEARSVEDLVGAADKKLYAAKKAGKNQFKS